MQKYQLTPKLQIIQIFQPLNVTGFCFELVTFAVDFIPLAVEFGTFAVEFVALAL